MDLSGKLRSEFLRGDSVLLTELERMLLTGASVGGLDEELDLCALLELERDDELVETSGILEPECDDS